MPRTVPVVVLSNVAGARSKLVTAAVLATVPMTATERDWMPGAGSICARLTLSDQVVGRNGRKATRATVGMLHLVVAQP